MKKIALLVLTASIGLTAAFAQDRDPLAGVGPNPAEGFVPEAHRFVFFAVLEGCYRDGLLDEDIEHIAPTVREGLRDRGKNFVISCPLCGPAFDAFNLYAERRSISRQMDKTNRYRTFGPGLDAAVKAELAKPGKPCRDTVQGLIRKWIDQRFAQLRLTDDEAKALREELARMREDGDRALARFQEDADEDSYFSRTYRGWERCPACSGVSPMAGE